MSALLIRYRGRLVWCAAVIAVLAFLHMTRGTAQTRSAKEKVPSADAPSVKEETEPLYSSLPLTRWYKRRYERTETIMQAPIRPADTEHPAGVRLGINLPEPGEFFGRVPKTLGDADELEFLLHFPKDFTKAARIYFFVKDWHDQWLHIEKKVPRDTAGLHSFRLPISGKAAAAAWKPKGHFRPWHQLTANQLKEYGVKITGPKGLALDWQGDLYLTELRLHTHPPKPPDRRITDVQIAPKSAKVGEMVEVSFKVNHPFVDPFDQQDVDLRAVLSLPDGESVPLRAFYFEDFLLDAKSEFSKQIPFGHPEFRIRFTPQKTGTYLLQVAGTIGDEEMELPEISVAVGKPQKPWKGFLRRDEEDDRLLAFSEDKSEFWGLGLNVRSPYDERYKAVFPFTGWENYNVNMYKRLFAKYEKAGINVVEIWMSSWWLALEWIADAPGNHGVGHMNQWRAWKLDQLLRWAKEHNIYVILAINNHGKFSQWCDPEWDRNPFNRNRGGDLYRPEQYFSSAKARVDTRRMIDYLLARWGYSPNILAWKLFTEIDLTGTRRGWYTDYTVTNWHRDTARYLKLRDPHRHLVTTHWSDNYAKARQSPMLAGLKELDLLTLDAYYTSQLGAQRLYNLVESTMTYQQQMRKPCIITEFGGTPWADTLPHILQQLHLGLWQGFFRGFAVSPSLWWFPLVEEHGLYQEYAALRAFSKGVRRRGKRSRRFRLEGGLEQIELRDKNELLVWIFDSSYFFYNNRLQAEPRMQTDTAIMVQGMQPGNYRAEFWNCRTGQTIGRESLEIKTSGSAALRLPDFRGDIAIKIRAAR